LHLIKRDRGIGQVTQRLFNKMSSGWNRIFNFGRADEPRTTSSTDLLARLCIRIQGSAWRDSTECRAHLRRGTAQHRALMFTEQQVTHVTHWLAIGHVLHISCTRDLLEIDLKFWIGKKNETFSIFELNELVRLFMGRTILFRRFVCVCVHLFVTGRLVHRNFLKLFV